MASDDSESMFHTHPCVADPAELKISCDDDAHATWDAGEEDCYCQDGFSPSEEEDANGFNHPCVKSEL
jgi:hypothetical protein